MTATAGRPPHSTGISSGGLAWRELDKGITTAVLRRSFRMLLVSTMHGRILRISDPAVGSRHTHQTSPRRGIRPGLRHLILHHVKVLLDGSNLGNAVRNFARPD